MGRGQGPLNFPVSRRIIIRSVAESDLTAIFEYYEHASPGLGGQFVSTFDAGISMLRRFPEIAPIAHLEYRRLLIRRFPYGIFYIVRPSFLSVGAIFHLRRDPAWIRRQLEQRE